MQIVTRGFGGPLVVTCGFGTTAPTIVTYADPRQAIVLSPDNQQAGVDPRQAYVITAKQ